MEQLTAARRGLGALIFLFGLASFVIAVIVLFISTDLGIGDLRTPGLLAVIGGALMLVGRLVRGPDGGLEDLADGLDGRATVQRVIGTARKRNGLNRVELDLLVDVPGRAPYPLLKTANFPDSLMAMVAPGEELPVKVDPTDPQRVGIYLLAMREQRSNPQSGTASVDAGRRASS
jgi:hypothetical protein